LETMLIRIELKDYGLIGEKIEEFVKSIDEIPNLQKVNDLL